VLSKITDVIVHFHNRRYVLYLVVFIACKATKLER